MPPTRIKNECQGTGWGSGPASELSIPKRNPVVLVFDNPQELSLANNPLAGSRRSLLPPSGRSLPSLLPLLLPILPIFIYHTRFADCDILDGASRPASLRGGASIQRLRHRAVCDAPGPLGTRLESPDSPFSLVASEVAARSLPYSHLIFPLNDPAMLRSGSIDA